MFYNWDITVARVNLKSTGVIHKSSVSDIAPEAIVTSSFGGTDTLGKSS